MTVGPAALAPRTAAALPGRASSGLAIRIDPCPLLGSGAPAAGRLLQAAGRRSSGAQTPPWGEPAAPRAEDTTRSRDPKTGGMGEGMGRGLQECNYKALRGPQERL